MQTYGEILKFVSEKRGKKVTHTEIAHILVENGLMDDIEKAANTLSNRKYNKSKLKDSERRAIQQHFINEGIDFPEDCPIVREDGCCVLYWEGCKSCLQDLKNPEIRPVVMDRQIMRQWGRDPKNMRIIAMSGDAMDGGINPIKNRNILFFDISDTNFANGGVYFYYTICPVNGKYNAGVARISITVDCKVKFNFDNPMKESEEYTKQELKAIGFNCVGRVLDNLSRNTF